MQTNNKQNSWHDKCVLRAKRFLSENISVETFVSNSPLTNV